MRWKLVNMKWRDYRELNREPTRATGLRAGMLIRVNSTEVEELLVGDVNVNGGFCDDCDIDPESVVLAELDLSSLIAEQVSRAKEPT